MSSFGQESRRGQDLARDILGRDPSLPLQPDELQLINRLLSEWGVIPLAFRAALKAWLATELPPELPINQLQGFTQFTATASTIAAGENTTSTTYTDLTTTGPQITGLSKGSYLVFLGCFSSVDVVGGANVARMSVQVNSTTASDDDSTQCGDITGVSVARVISKSLTQTSNTLTAKYRANAAGFTAGYSARWMIALRTA